ncbi:MAG: asparagine synthase (glutamine-hydrolyzing) [Bacteroidetes bacterium]|nr:asparagine synthase (glutamine-hydrolyzing) [Bacteroidota bacterium]
MCGITGVFAFNLVGKFSKINTAASTRALAHRGPDFQDIYADEWVCLGHRRLSIIDTREIAHQPMWDESGRYCIIFNGEIFNFRELRHKLEAQGLTFRTESDTEVLLKLYISAKESCLAELNGFFAFCIYDKQDQSMFLARDRYGIKPFYYLFDEDKFLFASEIKALIAYGIEKELDYVSLHTYLQLNYIPAPRTIFSKVKKLMPGHYAMVRSGQMETFQYYKIPVSESVPVPGYAQAQVKLREMLDAAVQRRLISDVPLGAFLSGGVDSSIVTALASRHKQNLHTFSIGFRDDRFFDETPYAMEVAKHCGTEHTVFSLSGDQMFEHVHNILDHIDEPFADSSAIAVYVLSNQTRKHATVALSGDGADELFAGYNKHSAFYRALHPEWKEKAVSGLGHVWKLLPHSRSAPFSNTIRQLDRFAQGFSLPSRERYWTWAGFVSEKQARQMLSEAGRTRLDETNYYDYKNTLLAGLPDDESMNDILRCDMGMVLANDMLTKVDLMSMAHGLEVRVPFLDVEVVNYIFGLPDSYKIDKAGRKKILRESFSDLLPEGFFNRPKKGFEVPMLKWLRRDLKKLIRTELLDDKFIVEQGIFNPRMIRKMRNQLYSLNPGDIHARMWGLVVFQWWWKKYCQ